MSLGVSSFLKYNISIFLRQMINHNDSRKKKIGTRKLKIELIPTVPFLYPFFLPFTTIGFSSQTTETLRSSTFGIRKKFSQPTR